MDGATRKYRYRASNGTAHWESANETGQTAGGGGLASTSWVLADQSRI